MKDDNYDVFKWADLFHDIGHLPFSHASEAAFSYFIDNKEDWTDYHCIISEKILKNASFNVINYLNDDQINNIIKIIREKKYLPTLLNNLLTGIINIDKLDYLKRDAYHAGTPEYAIIDAERIINSIQYIPEHEFKVPIFKKKSL